jgi:hypothetical protein
MPALVSQSVFIAATWIAAIFGGIGIGAAFVSAIVGYQLTEEALSDARIKIAASDARTKEAELKLERLRKQMGPRIIDRELFRDAISQQSKSKVEILYLRDDSEAFTLALQIQNNLPAAGWSVGDPKPIRVNGDSDKPSVLVVGGWHNGVIVATHSFDPNDQADSISFTNEPKKTSFAGLSNALLRTIGGVVGRSDNSIPEGTLRVIVGPKP